ncbi:MAG: DUF1330 domain-containing protein [Gammaproteobacteria bacterium]|nr:DUF1330 domain-containing protein [Gammaproteobacteria bacterium]
MKDTAAFEECGKLWTGISARYGAEVIAGKAVIESREGLQYTRHLIIRFESFQQALDCYEDPGYQVAMKLARQVYNPELSILEG